MIKKYSSRKNFKSRLGSGPISKRELEWVESNQWITFLVCPKYASVYHALARRIIRFLFEKELSPIKGTAGIISPWISQQYGQSNRSNPIVDLDYEALHTKFTAGYRRDRNCKTLYYVRMEYLNNRCLKYLPRILILEKFVVYRDCMHVSKKYGCVVFSPNGSVIVAIAQLANCNVHEVFMTTSWFTQKDHFSPQIFCQCVIIFCDLLQSAVPPPMIVSFWKNQETVSSVLAKNGLWLDFLSLVLCLVSAVFLFVNLPVRPGIFLQDLNVSFQRKNGFILVKTNSQMYRVWIVSITEQTKCL